MSMPPASIAWIIPVLAAAGPAPGEPATRPSAPAGLGVPVDPDSRRASNEKRFQDMLTGVVLRGTFQMTNADGLKGQAPMTSPRPERYAIQSVVKSAVDTWIITARIQFADRDLPVPVPVRVVWAGDTPVITLDTMKIPLLGTYSARVVIHEGFYAGTWSGAGYGGVLSGQIIKAEDEEKIKELEAQGFTMDMPGETPKRQEDQTSKRQNAKTRPQDAAGQLEISVGGRGESCGRSPVRQLPAHPRRPRNGRKRRFLVADCQKPAFHHGLVGDCGDGSERHRQPIDGVPLAACPPVATRDRA